MKKIAVVTKNLDLNGITSVIMNYSKFLNKKKYIITIIASNPINTSIKSKCLNNNISIIKVNKKGIKYYFEMLKIFKKNEFDIVHVHGNSATIFLELMIAKINGVKKIISHSHNTTCNHIIIHKLFRPFLNMVVTDRIACGKDAGIWMYGKSKFIVLNNGIDIDNFKYNDNYRKLIRKEYNIKNATKVIGLVGRFNNQKNQKFLIEVMKIIDSNTKLMLIGSGPNLEEIKKIIKKNKLNNIILVEETDRTNMFYNAFDLFVMPSLYEGLPVVLIEAQANGLKSLVSSNITSEVNLTDSIKFESINNPETWKDIIEKTNTKYKREELSKKNINELIKKNYSIKHNCKKLEQIYE